MLQYFCMIRLHKKTQSKIYLYILGEKVTPGMHNVTTTCGGTPEEQMQALRELGPILYEAYSNSEFEELRRMVNE